jgi:hypothetical protein
MRCLILIDRDGISDYPVISSTGWKAEGEEAATMESSVKCVERSVESNRICIQD